MPQSPGILARRGVLRETPGPGWEQDSARGVPGIGCPNTRQRRQCQWRMNGSRQRRPRRIGSAWREERVVGCDGTGVGCSRADGPEPLWGRDADRPGRIRERAVAELTETAEPPAVHLSFRGQGARMLV